MSEDAAALPVIVTILECTPPTRLVVDVPSPDGTWRLSVVIQAQNDGSTTLIFIQRLAEPYDAGSVGPGWHYYLDRLGAVVAGSAVPDDWDDYYSSLKDAYPSPG